jgi:VWFA-related protein
MLCTRRVFLAGLAGSAAAAWGQDVTLKAGVKVVNVLATVRDKRGQIVKTLNKEDFAIEEDGRPQTIGYFSRESNLELTLGLLVDTSMSQRGVLGEERSASYRFLDLVLREDKDMAFVIHFDREVELLMDLTSSKKQLEKALYGLQISQPNWNRNGGGGGGGGPRRGSGGGTQLYDAVLLAAEDLMSRQQGRKALVILSDGVDHGSKVSLPRAIDSAQKADTLVYCILFEDNESNARTAYHGRRGGGMGRPMPPTRQSGEDGRKVLQRLAKETGGGFFEVSRRMPISRVFERMDEELRSQYSIGYTPDKPPKAGEFRQIHLTTRDRDLIVQSRDGYYGAA